MSNGLTFEIVNINLIFFFEFSYRCWDMTWKGPGQTFKKIGSELMDKSTKSMHSR